MSSVEKGQMSAVETGQMTAAETSVLSQQKTSDLSQQQTSNIENWNWGLSKLCMGLYLSFVGGGSFSHLALEDHIDPKIALSNVRPTINR